MVSKKDENKMNYKYKSLFDVWEKSCEGYGDLIAFSDNKEQETITFKQAFRELCFLAQELQKLGLLRYDHVCLFACNSPRWLIIEQAIITLGAVCVSKTSEINIKELDYVFNNSDSVALITDKKEIINLPLRVFRNYRLLSLRILEKMLNLYYIWEMKMQNTPPRTNLIKYII